MMSAKNISLITVAISILALFISIYSSYIANKSYKLSAKKYNNEFMTILKSVKINENLTIQIGPTNEKVQLQRVVAHYPDAISENQWTIESPDYLLYISSPIESIKMIINKCISKEKNKTIILPNVTIPTIIETYYTIDGNNMFVKSMYNIELLVQVSDVRLFPSITVKGLIFSYRMANEEDTKQHLNEIWSEYYNQIKDYKNGDAKQEKTQ